MNWLRAYETLVERSRSRERPPVFEKHHVVPKCLGGSNDKSNIVFLTPKEHFFAHKLLVRIYPNNRGVWFALIAMGRLSEFKSRIFASERVRAREMRRGFRYSDEARAKMRDAALRRGVQKNSENTQFGKKPPWNKGLSGKDSHHYGRKRSPETRAKLRETMLALGIKPPAPPKGTRWGLAKRAGD